MCQDFTVNGKLVPYAPPLGGGTMTYRQDLAEVAVGNYGYVTARDARELGIPVVEMGKLAARGRLKRVGHGVYRVPEVPVSDRDQYAEAVLQVGPGARLVRDAVLALHGLALVNPRRIKVGTPRRVRTALPPFVEIVHDDTPLGELTKYEGIPSTTVARALIDSRGLVMVERLQQGLKDAVRQGLVTPLEQRKVRAALRTARP